MIMRKLLYWALILISLATLISGIVQIFAPGFILDLIHGESTPATRQGFGTVGMFMMLFGGMLLEVLLSRQYVQPVFLWAALQKIGAFIAVALGVSRHLFGHVALGVACFDLFSGILIFIYMKLAVSEGTES